MKRKILLSLIILLTITIEFNTLLAQSGVPTLNYGVWSRGADPLYTPDLPNYDYLVGVTFGPTWADIQPNNSTQFLWQPMQDAIDLAFNNNQVVTLKINVGPQCPDWIYNNVTKVFTDDDKFDETPNYQDQDYIDAYYALIDNFAAFVFGQPQEKQDIISFIFPQNGATGDEVGYKGMPLAGSESLWFARDSQEWEDFRRASWLHWKSAFQDNQPRPIPFLFNNVPFNDVDVDSDWNWVINNIGEDFGIKASNGYARGHHLTNEKVWNDTYTSLLVNQDPLGLQLFNRAEMDQSWKNPLYNINTELGFYWGAIGGLSTGLSIWDITNNALEYARTNTSVQETFRFFNKYANQIDPATSTKAFIVLHEGLNASDIVKFPETANGNSIGYGNAARTNISRYEAICNDPTYAKRGAQMDDPQSAKDGQVSQRNNQTGYNDAGWDIWPTNYARFIDQVDPDAESIGLFRIGGPIDENSSIYSRFARSFDNANGKNAMYFNMNEDFFSGAAGVVKISVIYYDNSATSTWELKYDAGAGAANFKTAFTVDDNTGSNTWKTRTIIVDDAMMLQDGTQVADFALVNTDTEDDIFHRIEIEQLDGTDTVSITSPVHGENFIIDENQDVIVNAIGYDNQGIQSMRFSIDGGVTFLDDASEPYANVFTGLPEGQYNVLVQMLDNDGNTLNSEEVLFNVLATAPTDDFIAITSPMDGDTFGLGQSITITADAFDNQDIDIVRFKIGNSERFFDNDEAPYTYTFTPAQLSALGEGQFTVFVDMRDVNGIRTFAEKITINIDSTLSIDILNTQEENEFQVYPTVVEDVLNWKSNIPVQQILVFDIAGREILNKKINNSSSINLSSLKSGIYLVSFQGVQSKIISKKIIKL